MVVDHERRSSPPYLRSWVTRPPGSCDRPGQGSFDWALAEVECVSSPGLTWRPTRQCNIRLSHTAAILLCHNIPVADISGTAMLVLAIANMFRSILAA